MISIPNYIYLVGNLNALNFATFYIKKHTSQSAVSMQRRSLAKFILCGWTMYVCFSLDQSGEQTDQHCHP